MAARINDLVQEVINEWVPEFLLQDKFHGAYLREQYCDLPSQFAEYEDSFTPHCLEDPDFQEDLKDILGSLVYLESNAYFHQMKKSPSQSTSQPIFESLLQQIDEHPDFGQARRNALNSVQHYFNTLPFTLQEIQQNIYEALIPEIKKEK